jgi:hypothetical protein
MTERIGFGPFGSEKKAAHRIPCWTVRRLVADFQQAKSVSFVARLPKSNQSPRAAFASAIWH